jgi:hypothetical protein
MRSRAACNWHGRDQPARRGDKARGGPNGNILLNVGGHPATCRDIARRGRLFALHVARPAGHTRRCRDARVGVPAGHRAATAPCDHP